MALIILAKNRGVFSLEAQELENGKRSGTILFTYLPGNYMIKSTIIEFLSNDSIQSNHIDLHQLVHTWQKLHDKKHSDGETFPSLI